MNDHWAYIRRIVVRETEGLARMPVLEEEDLRRLKILADIAKNIPALDVVEPVVLGELTDEELLVVAQSANRSGSG